MGMERRLHPTRKRRKPRRRRRRRRKQLPQRRQKKQQKPRRNRQPKPRRNKQPPMAKRNRDCTECLESNSMILSRTLFLVSKMQRLKRFAGDEIYKSSLF